MEIRDFISREWFASCDYEVDLIIRFFFFENTRKYEIIFDR